MLGFGDTNKQNQIFPFRDLIIQWRKRRKKTVVIIYKYYTRTGIFTQGCPTETYESFVHHFLLSLFSFSKHMCLLCCPSVRWVLKSFALTLTYMCVRALQIWHQSSGAGMIHSGWEAALGWGDCWPGSWELCGSSLGSEVEGELSEWERQQTRRRTGVFRNRGKT